MPFTPTHMIAVLPLARVRAIPFSALALGSMVPDFPLYFRIDNEAYFAAHSALGVFTLDLPLGLLAFLTWQALIKRPAIELLPAPARERLGAVRDPLPLSAPRVWAGGIAGALIGAATHVFWDSFTHANRWGVNLLPVLDRELLSVFGREVTGYKALQYGSTVVFLPLLFLLAALWLRRQPRVATPTPFSGGLRWAVWTALLVTPAAVGVAAALLQPTTRSGFRRLMGYAYEAATWGGATLIGMVIVGGLLFSLRLRAADPAGDEAGC